MFELYIANKNYSSWSLRPWLLLQERGIAFKEHIHPLQEHSNWEAYRAFSPSGRVPCLVDDGFAVWDSLAITEYVAERFPGVWPTDPKVRAWARCASAEMHSGFAVLRSVCSMNCGLEVELHTLSAELQKDVARIDELWVEGLTRWGGPYLAGVAFSAVDAFFAPVAFRVKTYRLPLSPKAAEYCKRILGLSSMRAWYEAALQEPWREPAHEAELRAVGVILADHRQA